MFTRNQLLRLAVLATTLGAGSIAAGQESSLSTPLTTLPQVSNERLGTGVPSRLPKVEVQRPVFTIQSGGPVAMPTPQFRPVRETTPTSTNEGKSSLPTIEQTRPWQKAGTDNKTATDRSATNMPQTRPVAARSTTSGVRPAASSPAWLQSPQTAELPTPERRAPTSAMPVTPRPQTRPETTTTSPAGETAPRVLNFSIN